MKNDLMEVVKEETSALVPFAEERAVIADRLLCLACHAEDLKVSSWTEFNAWNDYVAGKTDEATLIENARAEIESHSERPGKYLLVDKENPIEKDRESEKHVRAKRAVRIYKNICSSNGMKLCFFSNFAAWNDFVHGKTDELEFLAHSKIEAEKMKEKSR